MTNELLERVERLERIVERLTAALTTAAVEMKKPPGTDRLEQIIETVLEVRARRVHVTREDLTSKRRPTYLAQTRMLIWHFAYPEFPSVLIGERLGFDHGSVIHGFKRIKDLLSVPGKGARELADDYAEIEGLLMIETRYRPVLAA